MAPGVIFSLCKGSKTIKDDRQKMWICKAARLKKIFKVEDEKHLGKFFSFWMQIWWSKSAFFCDALETKKISVRRMRSELRLSFFLSIFQVSFDRTKSSKFCARAKKKKRTKTIHVVLQLSLTHYIKLQLRPFLSSSSSCWTVFPTLSGRWHLTDYSFLVLCTIWD